VSEYVQEIVQYIEELVRKKIAYESRGSVYFSVVRWHDRWMNRWMGVLFC